MTGAASRTRGANAERAVVNYLRANGWPDARRYLAGDGRQPGDIDAIPGVSIEVKDVAASAWPTWCQQSVDAAGPRIPIVVRRTRGRPDVGIWECRIPAHHVEWIDLAHNSALQQRQHCPRTGLIWVSTTFAAVINLIQSEQEAA